MSKKSQEKRKARAKEKAKAARRERGAGPMERLAGDGSDVECWRHSALEWGTRMVNMVAFRRMRGGGFAAAFFLVDYDCIGLKDAFYVFDVMPSELIARYREEARTTGSKVDRMSGEEVRRVVGGAVRWTREQGFRVPGNWGKCARILGGAIDVEGSDVREFGVEGGLRYSGTVQDLRKLLVNETVEEFLEREDVEAEFREGDGILSDEDEFEDEEEDGEEGANAALEEVVRQTMRGARAWFKRNGRSEPEKLETAVRLRIYGIAVAMQQVESADQMAEAVNRRAQEMMEEYPEEERGLLREAYEMVNEYAEWLGPGVDAGSELEDEDEEEEE